MSINDDDHELVRILEGMNLDEYELIPMEQPDDSYGCWNGSHLGFRKNVGAGTP